MCLRVAWEQPVRRFGSVNVPPGRGQRQGPRGFHTPYSPGRAWMQGPGRFGHVNVGGAGGLGGPAGQVQSAIVSNTNQCDQHGASVRKRYRRVVVTELACRVISGPRRAVGPTRVGESGVTGGHPSRVRCASVSSVCCASVSRARACPRYLSGSRRMALPHLCTQGWGPSEDTKA